MQSQWNRGTRWWISGVTADGLEMSKGHLSTSLLFQHLRGSLPSCEYIIGLWYSCTQRQFNVGGRQKPSVKKSLDTSVLATDAQALKAGWAILFGHKHYGECSRFEFSTIDYQETYPYWARRTYYPRPPPPPTPNCNSLPQNDPPTPSHMTIEIDRDTVPGPMIRELRALHEEHAEVFDLSTIPGYNNAVGPCDAVVNMGPVQPPQRKGRVPQYSRQKAPRAPEQVRRTPVSWSL